MAMHQSRCGWIFASVFFSFGFIAILIVLHLFSLLGVFLLPHEKHCPANCFEEDCKVHYFNIAGEIRYNSGPCSCQAFNSDGTKVNYCDAFPFDFAYAFAMYPKSILFIGTKLIFSIVVVFITWSCVMYNEDLTTKWPEKVESKPPAVLKVLSPVVI
jgi:hypothetical protein